MNELPSMGGVIYYRAESEIPIGNPPVVIANNTLFALTKVAPDKFLLVTPKTQTNINALVAQELAQGGSLVKKEMAEAKKMKKKKGILEGLFEAESAIQPSQTDPVVAPDVSLDQKVDKYLVRYEREAIPSSAVYDTGGETGPDDTNVAGGVAPTGGPAAPISPRESKKPKGKGLLESILFEAPGDEEDPLADPAADPAADAGGFGGGAAGGDPMADPAAAGGAPAAPPAPPVIDTPKMNMNSYCRAVARLIENYEALMNPKVTILNRAKEYVRVNYDEATAKMFEEVMQEQFGVSAETPERDQRMAPAAANAIYSGGGGAG